MLGVEMAMPFFVIGLLLYIAVGILQKLMPQVQLFLVLQELLFKHTIWLFPETL
jgi:flagellar biosynthesis protein FliR